jgi:predicted RNA-binding Zn-ribbon protein involved in translation (DUF1610 family)
VRVLLVDIETSPHLAWTFELKRAYIGIEAIVEPSRMLCFAACWLDEPDKVMFYSEWQHGHDGMLAAVYTLLDEADAVIHYNGERFDEPRMNQEFAQKGWAPPSPFQRIDLWKTISRRFDLPSQKLDYALRHFGLGGKLSTGGMRLWIGVMGGDEHDRRKMEEYNRNDVSVMVPLYSKLRPWILGHPNVNLYVEGDNFLCPTCGSDDVQKRGTARTDVSEFQRYRCNKCGRWSRAGTRIRGAELRAVGA